MINIKTLTDAGVPQKSEYIYTTTHTIRMGVDRLQNTNPGYAPMHIYNLLQVTNYKIKRSQHRRKEGS